MGAGAVDEIHTLKENDRNGEDDDNESQLSFNSSTHKEKMPVNTNSGSSDQFRTVRTVIMT